MSDLIDRLSDEVDALIRKIDRVVKAKKKHKVVFEHTTDDDTPEGDPADGDHGAAGNFNYGDGDSNPGMEAEGSDADDGDNDNDNEDDEDDDEEEDVKKALDGTDSETYWVNVNNAATRPGDLKHSTLSQPRHKFEALVDHIKNDQGVPKSEAMAIARQHYPDVYRSYQRHTNNSDSTSKSAPTTFEDLVEAEMRKGVTREIAGQRVMQAHGADALRHRLITKRDARAILAEDALIRKAQDIWADSDLDRCQSLREARLQRPSLLRRMG